jgi:putative RNA 2'-phosphotransferase
MGSPKTPKQLMKLMAYVLGQRPDEFGLVPDENGFVRVKDLVRAISEESGWGYVRKSHVHEVLVTCSENCFVVQDEFIRIAGRDEAIKPLVGIFPPKVLYCCVRRKAYPVVCRNGIIPMGQTYVFLATTTELAARIGRRRDQKPVLLTVQAQRAAEAGVTFSRQGELIYMVDHVPVEYFSGPPLPQEKKGRKEAQEPTMEPPSLPEFLPGSFTLDMERSRELQQQRLKRKGLKKDVAWKKDARRLRRKGKGPWSE